MLLLGLNNAANGASYKYSLNKCRQIFSENQPKITIEYSYGNLKYDFSKNKEELQELFKSRIDDTVTNEGKMMGLTSLNPHMQLGLQSVAHYEMSDGRICSYPKEIAIKVYFDNPVIYISSDLPKGSCAFNTNLRHEQTHIDIGYASMNLFLQELRDKVPDILRQTGVSVAFKDVAAKTKELEEINQQQIVAMFNSFQDAMTKQQNRLDTNESYNWLSSLCP